MLHVNLLSYRTECREGKLLFVPAPWEDSFLLCPKAPAPFPLGQPLPLLLPLAGLGFCSAFWAWLRKCFHSSPVCCAPCRRGAVGPHESLFSPYMARPCAVQPTSFTVVQGGGHELSWTLGIGGHPRLRPRWRVGAGPSLPPLAPTWGLGRERDRLCGPAYPYCFCGDPVPGVCLLSFLVVLGHEFLNHSECLLWVLGKITSLKCKD